MKSGLETSLALLSRASESGKVKTRLHKAYSEEQCLAIYTAMLRDALELASAAQGSFGRVSVYWATDWSRSPPHDLAREFQFFDHLVQHGEDLGTRMYNAMSSEFARGSQGVVLIGCDSPHLPGTILMQAAEMLRTAEVVLGPSEDGGYYLIGASRLVREPFERIQWGTSEVLSRTLQILERLKLRVAVLPSCYDLDRPEDLLRLWTTDQAAGCKHLRQVLSEIFSKT